MLLTIQCETKKQVHKNSYGINLLLNSAYDRNYTIKIFIYILSALYSILCLKKMKTQCIDTVIQQYEQSL